MAASSSSDESSNAPGNFHVHDEGCDAIESRAGAGYLDGSSRLIASCPLLKCPLCCAPRAHFYCSICVKSGKFTHSLLPSGESLSDMQHKYLHAQGELKVISQRYDVFISKKKSCENKQVEIKRKKEEIILLKQLIANKRSKLQELCESRDRLKLANAEKCKNLPKYPIKVKEMEDFVLDRIEKMSKLREKHQDLLNKLKETTRCTIQQLVNYIFPLSEVVLKDEVRFRTKEAMSAARESGHGESDKIAALADAKNTSYIRGKWVFHGSGICEMQYRIVAPSLPANGDYSAYLDWLSENKDDVPKTTANEITPSRIAGFRIVGALTYTTQLTNLISYYLNVRLPYKLAYGDFRRKLNEHQFQRKVSRLNFNIMYLAYTQQVNLRELNENHTLENLMTILDVTRSDLGRHGHHEVSNAPLQQSMDSVLLGIETTTTESHSESEDENWFIAGSSSPTENINSNEMSPAAQQSTITEGIMSSAANRFNSILRWIK